MWIRAERILWKTCWLAFISYIWGRRGPERGRAMSMTQVKLESILLNVWSGSFIPSHSGCREKNVLGSQYNLFLALACMAQKVWWAGLGCWRNMWQWQPGKGTMSSQWYQSSLASQWCQPCHPPFRSFLEDLLRPGSSHLRLYAGNLPLQEGITVPQPWRQLTWVWAWLDHGWITIWPFWSSFLICQMSWIIPM